LPRGGYPSVSPLSSFFPNFCFIISLAAFALEPNYDVRIDLSIGVLKAVEVSFALNNIDAARGLWIFKPVLPAEPLLA